MTNPLGPAPWNWGYALLVYSRAGGGKTFLFSTVPQDSTFILDFEGGLDTLRSRGVETPAISITDESQLERLYPIIRRRGRIRTPEGQSVDFRNIRFIGVDSVTELEKMFLMDLTDARRQRFARISEYGDTSQLMARWLRKFRNLRQVGYHVVLTALEMAHEVSRDKKGNALYHVAPLLQQKTARQTPGLYDACARLMLDPGSKSRRLVFESDGTFEAKKRHAQIDDVEPADLGALFWKLDEPRMKRKAPPTHDKEGAAIRQGKNAILDKCRAIAVDLGIPEANVDDMLRRHKDERTVLQFFEAMQNTMRVLDAPIDEEVESEGKEKKR